MLKVKIALATVRSDKTVSELAVDYQVHPVQISDRKTKLGCGACAYPICRVSPAQTRV